jgi:hypothetical protein
LAGGEGLTRACAAHPPGALRASKIADAILSNRFLIRTLP